MSACNQDKTKAHKAHHLRKHRDGKALTYKFYMQYAKRLPGKSRSTYMHLRSVLCDWKIIEGNAAPLIRFANTKHIRYRYIEI